MFQFLCYFVLSTTLFSAPNPRSLQPQVESLLTRDFETTVDSLEKLGPTAYLPLQTLAFDSNQSMEKRWKSLMALAKLAGSQSLPIVEKALTDSHWFMRSAGLTALEALDKKKSLKWAFEKLKSDPALMVRMKAFEVLRGQENNSITELFWQKLHSADSFHQNRSLWIRYDLAYELLQRPRKKDIQRWVSILHGRDNKLQAIASQALSKLSGQTSPSQDNQVSFWQEKYPQSQKNKL